MAQPRTPYGGLLMRDLRRPGQPMRHISIKLPDHLIEALDRCAAQHQASRTSLARTLLAQAVEQLEGAR